MITENGNIKTRTAITAQVQKELNNKALLIGIIYLVLGALLAVVYAVLVAVNAIESSELHILLFGAVLLLALGIIILFSTRAVAVSSEHLLKEIEAEFFQGFLISREYVCGELTAVSKVYYGRIVKTRESRNYLFIYSTAVTAIVVAKSDVTESELNVIRGLLANPAASGGTQGGYAAMPADPFSTAKAEPEQKETPTMEEEILPQENGEDKKD